MEYDVVNSAQSTHPHTNQKFKPTYSQEYIDKKLSAGKTSEEITKILLVLYIDAPDAWKRAIKSWLETKKNNLCRSPPLDN